MKLIELFKQNPNIIINTDIDGFLSGMILQTYLGCKIVGFSNSKSEVWVEPSTSDIYKPVYIDLFVNRPDVYCVEQHIIAIDATHNQKLMAMGTKFNPNLEHGNCTFINDYCHKYPFATVHYIIAKLVAEGVNVELPDLSLVATASNGMSEELGQILLRADDAMHSSLSAYKDNADSWWQWLSQISNNSSVIAQCRAYIGKQSSADSAEKKYKIGVFFKNGLQCDGADGAFTNIAEADGKIQPRIKAYADFLKKYFTWDMDLPDRYILHQGKFLKQSINPQTVDKVRNMIEDSAMYSYAFIYGPHSNFPNFSFTIDMK